LDTSADRPCAAQGNRLADVFQSGRLSEHRSRFERRTPQDPINRRDESLAFVADETTWRPPDWFARASVILVETTDPVNVGGVIRVMANTGFLKLRLVNPVNFDPWHVVGVAHYTQHIIETAQIYASLPEAVADTSFVLGVTGKHQRVERNALPLQVAVQRLADAAQAGERVAIVFGREDHGLTNTMLDACHFVTSIPTNPAYPSLNLAQAALLVLYQLFTLAQGQEQAFRPPRRAAAPASSALLDDLIADLERTLEAIDFLMYRPRASTLRSLRVLLYRARLDQREASLLRAIAIEVRKFLKRKGVIAEVGEIGAPKRHEADS
jgi:TrmH family RNA methyltransferase